MNLAPETYKIPFNDNGLVISRPDGRAINPATMSSKFGSFLRSQEMPHIRFHDLRRTAATNMFQLTGDFYTISQILGHTLKGIGFELGISGNLDAVTSKYIDVRLERKREVLSAYHDAVLSEANPEGARRSGGPSWTSTPKGERSQADAKRLYLSCSARITIRMRLESAKVKVF